jgi:hypothetical protein
VSVTYTVECGACKTSVPIEEGAIGRCVVCPFCGWTLAVVAAVPAPPVAPVAPPAPRRPTPPPPPELADYPPALRARYLSGPWSRVLSGLVVARWAALVSIPVVALHLLTVLATLVFARPELVAAAQLLALGFTIGALILCAFQLLGQVLGSLAPSAAGGLLAATSCGVALASALAFGLLFLRGWPLAAVLAATVLVLLSFGVWIEALGRIGGALSDWRLRAAASTYLSRYVSGMVVSAFLIGYATIAVAAGDDSLLRGCQVVTGAISLLLVIAYCRLLRAAEVCVSGRAPVYLPDGAEPVRAPEAVRPE